MKKATRSDFAQVPWWRRIPTLDEVEYEPINWLVEGLVPAGSFVLFVGKAGSYKSWMILDLARAVATGAPFAGRKTGPPRPVIYLDHENPRNTIAYRKSLFRIDKTPNLRYLGRWSPLPFPGIDSFELKQCAREARPLIIFDSLVRFHRGDENDNSQMAKVTNAFVSLAREGATVILLHHAGRDREKNYRGASELEAAPDIAYRVERTERLVTLRQFKNRVAEETKFEVVWTDHGFAERWAADAQ